MTSSSTRPVNDLLNNLRGEQFRHDQNIRGSRSHLLNIQRFGRTLPPGLFGQEDTGDDASSSSPIPTTQPVKTCPGPKPPKSWTLTPVTDNYDTVSWRAEALGPLLGHDPAAASSVKPLTILCLRKLLSITTMEEFSEVVPFLPSHLRRDLLRDTSIYEPLQTNRLFALTEPEGHAAGELIVVGPAASLPNDHFLRMSALTESSISSTLWEEADSWDSDDVDETSSLHTLVVLSARLTVSTLLTLPHTITHLALINLPVAVSLYRLPSICPIIVFLDLSYNKWLGFGALHATVKDTGTKMLERLEWNRWTCLETVILRDCRVTPLLLEKVNQGRWDVRVEY